MRKILRKPEPGERFGKLVVISNRSFIGKRRACECRCDCGKAKTVRNEHLLKGAVLSCGCFRKKQASEAHKKHGGKGTRLYGIWKGMRERCNNPKSSAQKRYYERGIRVAREWNDFSVFREWAVHNGYKDGLTIDRIDNAKGYGPGNCRWVTRAVQNSNKTKTIMVEVEGEKTTLAELARKKGISYGTLYYRLSHGRPLMKKQRRTK